MNKRAKSVLAYSLLVVIIICSMIFLAQAVIAYTSGTTSFSVNYEIARVGDRHYTPQCFMDCHLPFCVSYNSDAAFSTLIVNSQDVKQYFNFPEGVDTSTLKDYGIDYLTTETYYVDVPDYGICSGERYSNETGKNEVYDYECVTGSHQEAKKRQVWKSIKDISQLEFEKGKEYCFDIWGKLEPKLGENFAVDVIPSIKLQDKEFILSEMAWWNANWTKKKQINITGGNSNLVNFTVYLVVRYDSDMQANYSDIRFTNSSENEEYYYDLDWYNSTEAGIWLRIPVLVPGNNTIYMYYGNTGATSGEKKPMAWDDDYGEIYHFNDSNSAQNILLSSCLIVKTGTWTTTEINSWNLGNSSVYINGTVSANYGTFSGCANHPTAKNNFTLVFWIEPVTIASPSSYLNAIYEWSQGWTTYLKQRQIEYANLPAFDVRNGATIGPNIGSSGLDLGAYGSRMNSYILTVNDTRASVYQNGTLYQRVTTGSYDNYDQGFPKTLMKYHNQPGGIAYLTELRYYKNFITDDWAAREWQNKNSSYVWFGAEQSTQAPPSSATESQGDDAILQGIANSTINPATTYSSQQIYMRNVTDQQQLGRFDYVAVKGSQRWAFNYVTSNSTSSDPTSNFTFMVNITPVLYVWEATNLSYSQISEQVKAFINNTKQQ